VLIDRVWQEKRNAKRVIGPGSRRGAVEVARKTRQRLH
jgi:hypothetical protein